MPRGLQWQFVGTSIRASVSVARLLDAIHQHPEVLSRERFVSIFVTKMMAGFAGQRSESQNAFEAGAFAPDRPFVEGLAGATFDGLVAPGAANIDPQSVRAELDELRNNSKKVRDYASKTIAHLVELPTEVPRLDVVEQCVDAFEKTVLRYSMLIRASAPETLLPTWQYDWKLIFREPWHSQR